MRPGQFWTSLTAGTAQHPVIILSIVLLLAAPVAGCAQDSPTATATSQAGHSETSTTAPVTTVTTSSTVAPAPQLQLPRGGTTIFPRYRVVAYYGTAGTPSLGVLGDGPAAQASERLEHVAAGFATPDRTIQPAMELIVTIADRTPGPDGDYSHDIDPQLAWQYLTTARTHHQLLVLDIQPGRTHFLKKAQAWEQLLREPDVGLALDSEWRMPPGAIPGHTIGHANAAEINEVGAWLANLTRTAQLPQKLFVLHQFTSGMLPDLPTVQPHPELAIVQHIDGFGSPAQKLAKYRSLQHPELFSMGFKLFYDEDVPMLGPAETLALTPPPSYVSYQ
jgi:hypothetical protein